MDRAYSEKPDAKKRYRENRGCGHKSLSTFAPLWGNLKRKFRHRLTLQADGDLVSAQRRLVLVINQLARHYFLLPIRYHAVHGPFDGQLVGRQRRPLHPHEGFKISMAQFSQVGITDRETTASGNTLGARQDVEREGPCRNHWSRIGLCAIQGR